MFSRANTGAVLSLAVLQSMDSAGEVDYWVSVKHDG